MTRIRTIKPGFFRHAALYDAEIETGLPLRLAFAGLWCVADREGRFRWHPREIKLDVLPHDMVDFSRVLDALVTRGFVVRYVTPAGEFGAIPSWHRHQVVNNRETRSELPAPPKNAEKKQPHAGASSTREHRVPDAPAESLCNAQGEGEREEEQEGEREGEKKESSLRSDNTVRAREASESNEVVVVEGEVFELVAEQSLDEVERAVEAYNRTAAFAAWPRCEKLTTNLRATLRKRLDENGGLEGWCDAMERATKSSFLLGKTQRGEGHRNWHVDLHFLLQARSFSKLINGGYDDAERQSPATGRDAMREGFARAIRNYGG